jgi:hypothetical protein
MSAVAELWARQPGEWFCLSTKSDGHWRDYFFGHDRHDVTAFAKDHGQDNVYFCPHGFDAPRRRKEHAVLPRLLWADLDAVDPSGIDLTPSVAIRSSPGRYVGLWRTDRRVSEELNRRLTYALGADKGGWDLTQVLRVPNTVNYKYPSHPRVRLMWDDGPTYHVRDLEERLPVLPRRNGVSVAFERVSDDWRAIVRRLAPGLLASVTRRVANGKRSDVIWKIGRVLREHGATAGEVAAVLREAPCWRDKHGDDEDALRREVARICR